MNDPTAGTPATSPKHNYTINNHPTQSLFTPQTLPPYNLSLTNNSNISDNNSYACFYDFTDPSLQNRFFLVVVVMTSVCVVGTAGNLLIMVVLSRRRMLSSSSWFLIFLAMTDTSVMVCTVLLYVIEVIYDYTRNLTLYVAWFKYVKVVYLLSHISQDCSVYMTVSATFERFTSLWMSPRQHRLCCNVRGTQVWICLVILLVTASMITKYFELEVVYNDDCDGFGKYNLQPSELFFNDDYTTIHSVWFTNVVYIFLPFIILAVLNSLIFYRLKIRHERISLLNHSNAAPVNYELRLPYNCSTTAKGDHAESNQRKISKAIIGADYDDDDDDDDDDEPGATSKLLLLSGMKGCNADLVTKSLVIENSPTDSYDCEKMDRNGCAISHKEPTKTKSIFSCGRVNRSTRKVNEIYYCSANATNSSSNGDGGHQAQFHYKIASDKKLAQHDPQCRSPTILLRQSSLLPEITFEEPPKRSRSSSHDCLSVPSYKQQHSGSAAIERYRMAVGFHRKEKKAKNREATIVLFIVVVVFLICNAPAVALTLVENIDRQFLLAHPDLYSYSRDVVNLLTVINSSANIIIYLILGGQFRKELKRLCDYAKPRKSQIHFSFRNFHTPNFKTSRPSPNKMVISPRKTRTGEFNKVPKSSYSQVNSFQYCSTESTSNGEVNLNGMLPNFIKHESTKFPINPKIDHRSPKNANLGYPIDCCYVPLIDQGNCCHLNPKFSKSVPLIPSRFQNSVHHLTMENSANSHKENRSNSHLKNGANSHMKNIANNRKI